MTDSLSTTFTGRVASVNERGLRLDGHDSWFNLSKFAVGVVLPERGATVTVSVDSKGFLRAINGADGQPVTSRPNGSQNGSSGHPGAAGRDVTITRLAVLKAAAEYAASKPESKSTDVLKIAECWERWVNREATGDADDEQQQAISICRSDRELEEVQR